MQTIKRLQYLASRLEKINEAECKEAHAVVLDAINNYQRIEQSTLAQQDLYEKVWSHMTRALDYAEYPDGFEMEIDAIESEMAGLALAIRLNHSVANS
jgi:hypothetical protein